MLVVQELSDSDMANRSARRVAERLIGILSDLIILMTQTMHTPTYLSVATNNYR
jgi:hypothetical protein